MVRHGIRKDFFSLSFGGWLEYPLSSYSSETKELVHFIGPLIMHCDLQKRVALVVLMSPVFQQVLTMLLTFEIYITQQEQNCHTHSCWYYLADQVQGLGVFSS